MEKEGGREIIFNIFDGIHIVRGAEGGGAGGSEKMEDGRLTLTRISSVSIDEQCVCSKQK